MNAPGIFVGKELDIVSRGGLATGGDMMWRSEIRTPVTVVAVDAETFTLSNGEVWSLATLTPIARSPS